MRDHRVLAILALAIPASAAAGNVEDLFPSLVQRAPTQLQPIVTINGGSNPGTFLAQDPVDGLFDSSASLDRLSSQIAGQLLRFPIGSTVPSFTFQFDPNLNVFTRSTESLGPLQSDRAQTTGKGTIDVSFAYSHVEFDVFEGEDLDEIDLGFSGVVQGASGANTSFIFNDGDSFMNFSADLPLAPGQQLAFADAGNGIISGPGITGSHANPDASPAPFANGSVSVANVRSILDAELDVDVFAFFVNYGVTDWLDAGLVVPLLRVAGSGRVTTTGLSDTPGGVMATSRQEEDSFGFGDLILHSKAHVLTSEYVDMAVRGDLTLPTGDEHDFRGYGDPSFGGALILSKTFGIVSPHVNAGLNFRTDDPDLHSFRWAVGVDAPLIRQAIGDPFEYLTVTADVIGEHLLRDEEIGEDIVAFAGGLKVNPWRELVLSGNALVRLNSDGLRADVIPTFAVEYTFR